MSVPTPYLTIRPEIAVDRLRQFEGAIAGVRTFYAIKANTNAALIKSLHAAGAGFEVASWTECEHLFGLGVDPGEIIYSNPVKPPAHIRNAYQAGIRAFAFDSAGEVSKLAANAPAASVYLRLAVPNDTAQLPLAAKFGCEPSQATELMLQAREEGLRPIGLTFHVGSQCVNPAAWTQALEICGVVMRELADHGMRIDVLDIGGGFPVSYTTPVPPIYELGLSITSDVGELLPYRPELWAEPGRYLSAEAGVITTEVIGRAQRPDGEWLHLDMGVFQGLMECLESPGWTFPISAEDPGLHSSITRPFILTGPTCDSCDTFAADVELPESIALGDRLQIACAGAYTTEYGSSFNGFDPPTAHVVETERVNA